MEIPSASSFASPLKCGFLHKLIGRGWLYSGSWKKRYCVLDGTKLYFYESEDSKGTERSTGVISLDYYDLCEEMATKNKRSPYIFVVGTSVKGFFDNRHQFSTDSEEEMQAWIISVHKAIKEARQNRCRAGRHRKSVNQRKTSEAKSCSSDYSQKSDDSEEQLSLESGECLYNATKERARGPQGRRLPQRKSLFPSEQANRPRFASLSSPLRISEDEEEEEDQRDTKWLSVSMEEVDRREVTKESNRFTSSAEVVFSKSDEDTSERKLASNHQSPEQRKKHFGLRSGQHAAISKELEMKWTAGLSPRATRWESEIGHPKIRLDSEELSGNGVEERFRKVEEEIAKVEKKVELGEERRDSRFTEIVTEVQKLKEESQKALKDALEARDEHQLLVKECRALLLKLQQAEKSEEQHL